MNRTIDPHKSESDSPEGVLYDSAAMEAPEIDKSPDDEDDRPGPHVIDGVKVASGRQEPVVSPAPPNPERIQSLGILGITSQSFETAARGGNRTSRRKASRRDSHIALLREIAPEVVTNHNGTVMFTSRTILKEMQGRGGGLTADGRPIRGANFVGDIMGRHGLHLPVCVKDGRRSFMISMVNATLEEKEAAQELLNGLSYKEFAALPVA